MNHPEQQGQLRMDVIQTSHAWGLIGYSNWLVYDYYLIPRAPVTDVWVEFITWAVLVAVVI